MTTTTNPDNPELKIVDPDTGLQKTYLVLSEEERAKGFVRPYRDAYVHIGLRPKYELRPLSEADKKDPIKATYAGFEKYPDSISPLTGRYWTHEELNSGCGTLTVMGRSLSETYARDPKFYGATYCAGCQKHFPVHQFHWNADNTVVGS